MTLDLLSFFSSDMVSAPLTRYAAGSYDDQGKWKQGTPDTSTLLMVKPQPLQPDDLKQFPQGEEAVDYLKSYTKANIRTRDKGRDADVIEWKGYDYKVLKVANRDEDGGFRRFIMVRERGQV